MKIASRVAAGTGALVLSLALAACGGPEEAADTGATGAATQEPAATATTGAPGDAAVDEAHNDADTMFAQMMIVHHEGAIEMSDLAVEKADSEKVRALAEGISAAQGPEIETMTSWLEAWGEETTPMDHGGMDHGGMDMEGMSQEEAMAELEGLSGPNFDRRFLELMTAHHEGAVTMAEDQLADGENPQALELAQKIIDDQQAEIAEMEQLLQGL
ncbi:DUF305 domain-containing protein [Georgenia sp. SUBG003]|uniref:DUF305 domain-containing protein n=1 Tax=Georgenia sp. SUBG003 TaxID=1497974 RepID=UPI0004DAD89B|nr:hypothetical protein DA06_13765 [Georgenia sp. SUBG003]